MQLLGREKYADEHGDTGFLQQLHLYGTMVNASFITICIPINLELLDDMLAYKFTNCNKCTTLELLVMELGDREFGKFVQDICDYLLYFAMN